MSRQVWTPAHKQISTGQFTPRGGTSMMVANRTR